MLIKKRSLKVNMLRWVYTTLPELKNYKPNSFCSRTFLETAPEI
jgi:hypothetical protein